MRRLWRVATVPAGPIAVYARVTMLEDVLEVPVPCSLCGRELGRSTDDQPDWPTGPMCGDCYQAREMDNELWWTEDAAATE
jgi:hypothetical protein